MRAECPRFVGSTRIPLLRTEAARARIRRPAHSPNGPCRGRCQARAGGSPECAGNTDAQPARRPRPPAAFSKSSPFVEIGV